MALRILMIVMVLGFVLFRIFPQIDLWMASGFFIEGKWAGKAPFLWFFRNLYFDLSYVVLVWAAVMFVLSWLGKLQAPRKVYSFIASFFLLGPVILVNGILKAFWGRARPYDVTEFGGVLDFTPISIWPVNQCTSNCSFVSGEGAAAFTMIILIFILSANWRWALWAFLPMAVMRIMAGAHFLSDVIFAGLFMVLVCIGLMRVFSLSLNDLRQAGSHVKDDSFGWLKRAIDRVDNPSAD